MADNSKIEWTNSSWQVTGGCDRASEGCRNCYAERLVGTRQRHLPVQATLTEMRGDGRPHWTGTIALYEKNLTQPVHWRTPRKIFVNSLSDLFHPAVPFEYIDKVFAVMALCPQHTFQILTKRPERMREYLEKHATRHLWAVQAALLSGISRTAHVPSCHTGVCNCPYPLPNVWLGTSVEDQETADTRIPPLLQTPAAVRFVSYEPALGPVDFRQIAMIDQSDGVSKGIDALGGCRWWCSDQGEYAEDAPALDWVIVGGESGFGARPFHLDWAYSVLDERGSIGSKTAIFVKQLGAAPFRDNFPLYLTHRKGAEMQEWPGDLRVREFPAPATQEAIKETVNALGK